MLIVQNSKSGKDSLLRDKELQTKILLCESVVIAILAISEDSTDGMYINEDVLYLNR